MQLNDSNFKEDSVGSNKKIKIIQVYYVPPPVEVVEAVKNANKPRITILKGYSLKC